MARKAISWILNFTAKLPNEEEKIKCLRANDNNAIRTILKFALDPNIKWALPEGAPPYTPSQFPHQENNLYQEVRRLYLFLDPATGGNPNLNSLKRESLFVTALQEVDPEDAKLLLAIKDKTLPYEGLTSETVLKAFPGLY